MLAFYKGPRNAYDLTTHGNGIYFTTDTCEIIHDGKTYSSGSKIYSNGSDSEKTIIDIQLNGNELTIEYSDGSTLTIPLLEHTAGTNISIEDRVISALGYTWNDDIQSFAEGDTAEASGECAHAEGIETQADGVGSHAEGYKSIAGNIETVTDSYNKIDDTSTDNPGEYSHAEGKCTVAAGAGSHSEGKHTYSNGIGAHAEGYNTFATGTGAHAEGDNTKATSGRAHSEGEDTLAQGRASHAEGFNTRAEGEDSHAEGSGTKASGLYSHAEGYTTTASGNQSHSEGSNTTAEGDYSHAEGRSTFATGDYSHAEGYSTVANASGSHAEGSNTRAQGNYSHVEGEDTRATGTSSHAEGLSTNAQGKYSHTEGYRTLTTNEAEHAEGKFNGSNTGTLSSIGIGTSYTDRKNAFEVMDNGDVYVYGVGDYDGTNSVIENPDGVKGQSLQTIISSNINRIQVVNVTNLPYTFTDKHVDLTDTKILFNLNCDARTLYENQDDFYVTLSKYSNRRKKQIVLNDMIQSDERLKVYCWVIKNNSIKLSDWTYFYTLDDYDDNVDDLLESDPDIFTKRRPHCTERLDGSLGMTNNYINYIDELCYDGLNVSDVNGLIERCISRDSDKYFVGNLSKNPIARWKRTDFDESELLTSSEKYDFFASYLSNLIFWRGIHPDSDMDMYSFHSYVDDYPIYPVKLSDCDVIVYGNVADELGCRESQGIVKLYSLTLSQLLRLSQITLIFPFNANYIVKRLYLPEVWDFEFRDPKIIDKYLFEGAGKIGGNRKLKYGYPAHFKNYLKLGICDERQLHTNTFKDIPQYDFKLITFDIGNQGLYNYNGYDIEILLTRVM